VVCHAVTMVLVLLDNFELGSPVVVSRSWSVILLAVVNLFVHTDEFVRWLEYADFDPQCSKSWKSSQHFVTPHGWITGELLYVGMDGTGGKLSSMVYVPLDT